MVEFEKSFDIHRVMERVGDLRLGFATNNGKGFLLAALVEDGETIKLYGRIPVLLESLSCEGCIDYSFSLKNVGKQYADVFIDLLSFSDFELTDKEKDPKITTVNCGGLFDNKGCRMEISKLSEGDEVLFTGVAKGGGIRDINCKISGFEGKCSVNFHQFYIQKIMPGLVLKVNDREVNFPPINNTEELMRYHYEAQENSWVEF